MPSCNRPLQLTAVCTGVPSSAVMCTTTGARPAGRRA
jgi:hypothetical protein